MNNFSPALKEQRTVKASVANIDKFIEHFNKAMDIKKHLNADGSLSLNTGLNHIIQLNDYEFTLAVTQAKVNGYELTRYEDNYQTVSYKLKPIK